MVCVRKYASQIRFANFFVRMFFKEKRFFFCINCKNMKNTVVSLFRGFADKNPKEVNLYKALVTKKFKSEIEALRAEPDPAKQKKMKKRLPSFSVSGVFKGGRLIKNLSTPSNFICIDIDQKDNTNITNFSEFKDFAEAFPWVAYCGLSCRGKGFFLVIPYADSTKHKKYFDFIEKLFSLYGVVIDRTCRNINRLRFVSFDDEPYINEDATPFDFVLPSEPPKKMKSEKVERKPSGEDGDQNLEALRAAILQKKVDITPTYEAWWKCLCAVATELGDAGEDYAHDLCQFYGGYSVEETSKKYREALKNGAGTCTAGTLFYYAKQAGITKADLDFYNVKL